MRVAAPKSPRTNINAKSQQEFSIASRFDVASLVAITKKITVKRYRDALGLGWMRKYQTGVIRLPLRAFPRPRLYNENREIIAGA